MYRFINDQTLTYINQGYTPNEIANMISLPDGLAKNWYTRQYYGTVAHNAKAVYQKYMGWYDANPVNLHPLPPAESAAKWQEYMALGSVEQVLRQAKKDFEDGQYQWVAEVTNTIVYADPENMAARLLCADALEQLGYQAESGPQRNAYLTGAYEQRSGVNESLENRATNSGDQIQSMTAKMTFDCMGIVLNKQAMANENFSMSFTLTDTGERFTVRIVSGVLLRFANSNDENADVSITTKKNALMLLARGDLETFQSVAKVEGKVELLEKFTTNMTEIALGTPASFNIVEP